jgi:hypothetical protein
MILISLGHFSLFAWNFMVDHVAKYSLGGVFALVSPKFTLLSGSLLPILLAFACIPCSDS